MSIITVQIGQCGNQIGEKFFDTLISDCYDCNTLYQDKKSRQNFLSKHVRRLNEDYVQESTRRFFTEAENSRQSPSENEPPQLYARSVLIDMESKVVNKLIYNQGNSRLKFRDKNSYTQKKGSGNNWSYGYCVNGPKSMDKIEEIFRKEAERCDRLACFFVCMSLAGGTGSGVGSYYTEFLRDHYPRAAIVNNCVWPFSTGEVTLQNYNFLLTLNKLYEHSDAVVLLENDILHQICKRVHNVTASNSNGLEKKPSAGKREITFDDLNETIGHQLASLAQPALNDLALPNHLNEVVSDLCAHTDYKLLSLHNVPHMSKQAIEFSSFHWTSLYRNAGQLLKTGGYMDEGLNWAEAPTTATTSGKMLAVSLFARGLHSSYGEQSALVRDKHFDERYVRAHFAAAEQLFQLNSPVRLWYQERTFNNYEKSVTLLSNSQLPATKIEALVGKAWRMFASRAYIHQYLRHDGFEEEDLLNAFVFTEQLIKNYKGL